MAGQREKGYEMSEVFINGVLTEVGQGADEIISLRRQLVESQAREHQLRCALELACRELAWYGDTLKKIATT